MISRQNESAAFLRSTVAECCELFFLLERLIGQFVFHALSALSSSCQHLFGF